MNFVIHSGNEAAYVALRKELCKKERQGKLFFLQGPKGSGKTALLDKMDAMLIGRSYGIYNSDDLIESIEKHEICEEDDREFLNLFDVFFVDGLRNDLDSNVEASLQNFVNQRLEAGCSVCLAGERVSEVFLSYMIDRKVQFLVTYPPEPYELVEITQRLLNEADLTCTKSFIKGIVAQIGCSIGEAEAAVDLLTAYAKKENIKRFDSYLNIDDVAYELIYDEEANEADAAEINTVSPMPMSIHELLDWERQLVEQNLLVEVLLQKRIDLEKKFVKLDLEKTATEVCYDIFIQIYFIGKLVEELLSEN